MAATPAPHPQSFHYDYLGLDAASFKHSIANHLVYAVGKDPITATPRDWFHALAYATRARLIERWMETMRSYYHQDVKRVYYLSMEFLMGRALTNSLLNMGCLDEARAALADLGLDYDQIQPIEPDAALGNGGLGRLAACYLDSMATLRLPGYGYGIRYEYGMFTQRIEDGAQVEHPDNWLRYGNPWEFPRPEVLYPVRFHGRVIQYRDEHGENRSEWVDTTDILAMAYDTPVPGYHTNTVNNMRLWAAKATREFDLQYFNEGNYIKAVEAKNASENLSKVLYPDDTSEMGRELRLKQEYFFVSATLQDILFRYGKTHQTFDKLPDKVAIQLNDTHPSIGIAELMRLLVDLNHVSWDAAWDITRRTFAYTNHTLMPEALETWPVAVFERVLPRHLQIIYEINHRFMREVNHRFPGDVERMKRMSIVDEDHGRRLRMSHLAIVGGHHVNGVAMLHTELMKSTIFRDFAEMWPERFVNITNGITPRRWLNQANPGLAALISERIGTGWVSDLGQLSGLAPFADDEGFRAAFRAVKEGNKYRLAATIARHTGIHVDPKALFDVQVKRIHEYKRQLLNALHVVTRYNRIRHAPQGDHVARAVIFAGKSAPAYAMAKRIIRLINDVADTVNNDPCVADRLKVVFIPNYDVSTAIDIIPAADLSEQISTAGTEASGTGNMKFALNGALTLGTLDGANIEIRDAVGHDNFFLFGMQSDEVQELFERGYRPRDVYESNGELREALDMIANGFFSPEDPDRFRPLVDNLLDLGDRYALLADYADYIACQERVDALWRDREEWTRRAVLNTAGMGHFSSDRAIMDYATQVWGTSPVAQD